MTEQRQEKINTPFVLNAAYDKLIQFGINPDYYWVKQLRQLAQSWGDGTPVNRIHSLEEDRERMLKTIDDLKRECEKQTQLAQFFEARYYGADLPQSESHAINSRHGDKQNQGS